MNKNRIRYIYILFFLFILACKKDTNNVGPSDPQLPPITTEGKGTFGCKINGKVWIPNVYWGAFTPSISMVYSEEEHELIIITRVKKDTNDPFKYLHIYLEDFEILDSIKLINSESKNWADQGSGNIFYETDSLNYGYLKFIKFDPDNNIFSGTFWFDAFDEDTQTKIEIREGRFDLTRM